MNRLVTGRLARCTSPPTESARRNLLAEGISGDRIVVTGNSGIDAVLTSPGRWRRGRIATPAWPWLDPARKLIVVTAHRRESFGDGIERICDALAEMAARPDVQIVYPVHRNPNVLDPVTDAWAARPTSC